jgi:WhiB family transcriptional regulator, redox-sensing transcriptional regulator
MDVSRPERRRPVLPVRAEDLEWQLRARCRGLPTEIFFAFDSERGSRRAAREEHAKNVCRSCAVHDECLRYAMASVEPWGIWGATTPAERRRIAH